jgi:hypothetical protein
VGNSEDFEIVGVVYNVYKYISKTFGCQASSPSLGDIIHEITPKTPAFNASSAPTKCSRPSHTNF